MLTPTRSRPRCSDHNRFGIRREQWTADSLHVLEYAEPSVGFDLERDDNWCDQCDQRTKTGKHIGRERSEPEHPRKHPSVFWSLNHQTYYLARQSTPAVYRGKGWPKSAGFDDMLKYVYDRSDDPIKDRYAHNRAMLTIAIIEVYTGEAARRRREAERPTWFPVLDWLKENRP
jgi:hypothetical protein